MRRLIDDLRRARRALTKSPLFTTVAVAVVSLGLALALALNTTMFALADAVVHPYVPYPESDRIIVPMFRGGDTKRALTFDFRFAAIRDGLTAYDRIAAYKLVRSAMIQSGTKAEYRWVAGVSPEFFDVLGVRAMLGTTLGTSRNATQGAVISFRLWNRFFNGRPPFIFGTVVMVLIIACANLGTMMIARGLARRRETAIRMALGANWRDISREVLCECTLIGASGLTLGLLLSWWALYILPHYTIAWVPELGDLQPVPGWRVFTFALGASAHDYPVIVRGEGCLLYDREGRDYIDACGGAFVATSATACVRSPTRWHTRRRTSDT